LLDIDDEIAGEKVAIVGEANVNGQFDAGHDGAAIFVDEIHADAVGAFLDPAEDKAEGDGALGVDGGQLMGDDGVEGAQEIEFAGVIGGGVTEHGDLNVHSEISGRRCCERLRESI
jgi:hypothetical protein